jgi:hypothetical protein
MVGAMDSCLPLTWGGFTDLETAETANGSKDDLGLPLISANLEL